MSDFISRWNQLTEFYGAQRLAELKDSAAEKQNAGTKLTLREDFLIHPEKWPYPFPDKMVPRAVQQLYRDLISTAVSLSNSGDTYGVLDIDNVLVDVANNFSLRMIADKNATNYPGDLLTYPAALDRLAQQLHPPGNPYPKEFCNFQDLLSRVENLKQLQKLHCHPSLLTSAEKGLLIYRAYVQIAQKAKTDASIWTRFEKTIEHINIENKIKDKGHYWSVYVNYKNDYTTDAKGVLHYFKDVLQHFNDYVDEENQARKKAADEAQIKAAKAAEDAAIKNQENIEAAIEEAMAKIPEPPKEKHFSLHKLVENLEIMFPEFLLTLYIFLIDEDIDTGMDQKEEGTPLQGIPQQSHPHQSQQQQPAPLQPTPPPQQQPPPLQQQQPTLHRQPTPPPQQQPFPWQQQQQPTLHRQPTPPPQQQPFPWQQQQQPFPWQQQQPTLHRQPTPPQQQPFPWQQQQQPFPWQQQQQPFPWQQQQQPFPWQQQQPAPPLGYPQGQWHGLLPTQGIPQQLTPWQATTVQRPLQQGPPQQGIPQQSPHPMHNQGPPPVHHHANYQQRIAQLLQGGNITRDIINMGYIEEQVLTVRDYIWQNYGVYYQ